MTSGRPPWQILGDGQPGAEDEQGQPEPEEVAAAKAGPEHTEPAKAAAGAGQLVLTHLAPGNDPELSLAGAQEAFPGPVSLAAPGRVLHLD